MFKKALSLLLALMLIVTSVSCSVRHGQPVSKKMQ